MDSLLDNQEKGSLNVVVNSLHMLTQVSLRVLKNETIIKQSQSFVIKFEQ